MGINRVENVKLDKSLNFISILFYVPEASVIHFVRFATPKMFIDLYYNNKSNLFYSCSVYNTEINGYML